MKKITTSIVALCLLSVSTVFGQTTAKKPNTRAGESVEYCITHKKMNELLKDPDFATQYAKDQLELEQNEKKGSHGHTKATVYRIPIVFHVLHYGGSENISKEQIQSAMEIVNRDYRRLNADANTVDTAFQGMPSDVEIEFVLATKAPNGACFSGITRTYSPLTNQGANGGAQVNAIIAGNDVFQGQWPGNKYLNVFVCQDIGGAAGYTTNPGSGSGMTNGIWMLSTYTGNIGTSSEFTSRTLTHEAGHWLNLSHTWGGTNDPGVSCSGSDGVSDTPKTIGLDACTLNANTCSNDNAYWGFDKKDNVENYMDYSYCSKMFTQGQVDRMRTAITSTVSGRNNVISAANATATGIDAPLALCSAKFSTPKTVLCAGDVIQYTDESFNVVTGWNWTFAGGTPSSSTDQNPSVTYNTPGTYTVTLTATDGSSSDGETRTNYITVLPASEGIPYYESFEGISSFTGSPRWIVENPGANNAWSVTNTAGNSGTNSAKLTNFGQPVGGLDELVSKGIDLSGITSATGATLSFRYAYRKKATANDEFLKVYLTKDCGDSWEVRKTIHGSSLSSLTSTSSWTPTADDWVTIHMTNVTSIFWEENFRFKFRFEGDGGNNIYLDDINIYSGAPSDVIILGTEDSEVFSNATLFPNPADEEVNVSFNTTTNQPVSVVITDLLGNIVQQHSIKAITGNNLVSLSTEELSNGMYMVRLTGSSTQKTLQFVVK